MLDTTFLGYVTRDHFLPVLKNNIYNQTPLLKLFLSKGRVKEWYGTALLWDVVAKKHQSLGLFKGYSTIPNQPVNPVVQATLPNANYVATIAISKEEEKKNTGNAEKLLDILKVQMQNAEDSLRDRISTDLYGTGAQVGGMDVIQGLGIAVTGSTGTYAGINRATAGNAFWQSNYSSSAHTIANMKDPTSTSYLPSLMYTAFTNATHGGSPDVIVTTKTIFNYYMLIAQINNLQVTNASADLGFAGVRFMGGVDMFFDDYCTAYAMYFLRTEDWSVFVFPGANFDFDEEDGSIWKKPTDQLAKVAHLLWMGQLRLDAPWRQAVYTSLGAS